MQFGKLPIAGLSSQGKCSCTTDYRVRSTAVRAHNSLDCMTRLLCDSLSPCAYKLRIRLVYSISTSTLDLGRATRHAETQMETHRPVRQTTWGQTQTAQDTDRTHRCHQMHQCTQPRPQNWRAPRSAPPCCFLHLCSLIGGTVCTHESTRASTVTAYMPNDQDFRPLGLCRNPAQMSAPML